MTEHKKPAYIIIQEAMVERNLLDKVKREIEDFKKNVMKNPCED